MLVVGAATLVISAFFVVFPEADQAAAAYFYTGGNGFLLRDGVVHRFVDEWIRPYLKDLVILMLALACVSLASGGRILGWSPRAIAFVVLSYAIGPGLLVNGLLKTFIGRARPKHIMELGGDKLFSTAFAPADQCASNCSFVSGDVAFVAATLTFALLLSGTKRRVAVLLSLLLTAVTGYYRMAVGAHFLSDVVLAGLFCVLITLALHRGLFSRANNPRGCRRAADDGSSSTGTRDCRRDRGTNTRAGRSRSDRSSRRVGRGRRPDAP
ncbi:MAG: phosphatase PAP2 family protein [Proteobacteria bacterium]|nr:phosphatase PAP2 family protein [Pseudomonadota bacterium]MDA1310160.1 phosphatase PAP2 family protein [Pseudomonadota bacterium]